MIKIQRLICRKNKNFHRGCKWRSSANAYPDNSYNEIVKKLCHDVKAKGIAARIIDDRNIVLITIKRGHDGNLWRSDK